MSGQLSGKRIIVTGGTSGIGRQVCLDAACEGARIAFCGLNAKDSPTLDELRQTGHEPFFREVDLTDLSAARQFARDAIAHLGGLDGLFNNAGVNYRYSVLEATPEIVREAFRVNYYSQWVMAQEAHAALKAAGWGMIVNMSSINASKTTRNFFPYNAAKAAVEGLTRAIALEWARDNIQCVALAPAFVRTDKNERWLREQGKMEALISDIKFQYPIGHPGASSDVSSFVVYLLSGANRFISGTTVLIDGGVSVQMLPRRQM